jgi:hypothetical protein
MNWTSGALDGRVSVEVEVILEWMSDIMFNQGSWNRVAIAISCHSIPFLGEEADVMALGTDSNSPFDLFRVSKFKVLGVKSLTPAAGPAPKASASDFFISSTSWFKTCAY